MFEKTPQNLGKMNAPEGKEVGEKGEIKAIEQLPLNFDDKEASLLVYLKEKPAALIGPERSINFLREGSREELLLRQIEREKIEVQENLDRAGLLYEIRKREIKPEDRGRDIYNMIGYDIYISYNQGNLNRLIGAREKNDDEEIGLALGYPESAIEGFSKGESFDEKNDLRRLSKKERDGLKNEGVFKFLLFKPSKDHWREEIELVRKHQKAIKAKSPQIYNEIIKLDFGLKKRYN